MSKFCADSDTTLNNINACTQRLLASTSFSQSGSSSGGDASSSLSSRFSFFGKNSFWRRHRSKSCDASRRKKDLVDGPNSESENFQIDNNNCSSTNISAILSPLILNLELIRSSSLKGDTNSSGNTTVGSYSKKKDQLKFCLHCSFQARLLDENNKSNNNNNNQKCRHNNKSSKDSSQSPTKTISTYYSELVQSSSMYSWSHYFNLKMPPKDSTKIDVERGKCPVDEQISLQSGGSEKQTVNWIDENLPNFWKPDEWPQNSPDLYSLDHYVLEVLQEKSLSVPLMTLNYLYGAHYIPSISITQFFDDNNFNKLHLERDDGCSSSTDSLRSEGDSNLNIVNRPEICITPPISPYDIDDNATQCFFPPELSIMPSNGNGSGSGYDDDRLERDSSHQKLSVTSFLSDDFRTQADSFSSTMTVAPVGCAFPFSSCLNARGLLKNLKRRSAPDLTSASQQLMKEVRRQERRRTTTAADIGVANSKKGAAQTMSSSGNRLSSSSATGTLNGPIAKHRSSSVDISMLAQERKSKSLAVAKDKKNKSHRGSMVEDNMRSMSIGFLPPVLSDRFPHLRLFSYLQRSAQNTVKIDQNA
uniref:Uncharacterized protein n=1 Tax=Romanomermis culicivorax TaxID=13658 RepID=A0A915L5V2_ROMCU